MIGTSLSPAGSALLADPSIDNETEDERQKRLRALAQSQNRLGTMSPASRALLGYGGSGAGIGGGLGVASSF